MEYKESCPDYMFDDFVSLNNIFVFDSTTMLFKSNNVPHGDGDYYDIVEIFFENGRVSKIIATFGEMVWEAIYTYNNESITLPEVSQN